MDTQTQNQYIYQWLLAGRSITTLEAMLHHGIGRLASRICDLTKDYNVPICKEREPNSDGKGYHTRYWMSKEDRDRQQNVPLSKVHEV
jgi:hypothetical protein